jgi:uncharacterized protein involved in type VI secretion and phage assembly
MSDKVTGVLIGKVKDIDDPHGEGTVRVEYSWMGGSNVQRPAPIVTLMAGNNRGSWFMPEVGDEVVVAFDRGDINQPYILGFLWNGEQKPPSTNPKLRKFRSLNGHQIEFMDSPPARGDQGYLSIKDAHGNEIRMKNGEVSISSTGTVRIDAKHVFINGRRVLISPGNI